MSRGLCVLAAMAILASGCASRGAADRLESDVGRLRSELAEMRVAQQATSRELAAVTSQVQSLDVRTLQDDVARLNRRADALDTALLTKVDAVGGPGGQSPAPQRSSVPAPALASPVPAPLPPTSAVMSPPPAPLPPDPAAMTPSPAPAPQNRAAIAPPAPLPPPAVMAPPMSPAPPLTQAQPLTQPPLQGPPPTQAPPAVAAIERPRATPPPAAAAAPAGAASKTPGNPEQEYAAALATYRAHEHGQAVIEFMDFIAKYPKHPLAANAQYWIGEAYWAQRDYRQALIEFGKVFERGPTKAPDALLKIGLCHLRLNDVARAQQAWQRVVDEYPKSEPAAMARSLIATHSSARR